MAENQGAPGAGVEQQVKGAMKDVPNLRTKFDALGMLAATGDPSSFSIKGPDGEWKFQQEENGDGLILANVAQDGQITPYPEHRYTGQRSSR